MQLSKRLSMAVCTLLSVGQTQASETFYDLSILSYSEQDNQQQDRVAVFEPVLSVTSQKADDDYFKYDLVFDSLSGSSPNGANASSVSQQMGSLQTEAGYTPVDPRFSDNRLALNLSWMTPLDRLSRYKGGISLSYESDYRSAGFDYSYFEDLNNKLTTLMIGGALSYDAINPASGFGTPLSSISGPVTTSPRQINLQTTTSASGGGTTTIPSGGGTSGSGSFNESESDGETASLNLFPGKAKVTYEGMVGISHIYNQYTLLNLNYGLSYVDGYQTDPYKLISVIDSSGLPVDYVWEKRPSSRLKQTLKGSLVTAIGKDSLHLDYRYYQDDWGITSKTLDVKYYLELGHKLTIAPHYRRSDQTRADFFRISLNENETLPAYASADYRLGDMQTNTTGAMLAYHFNPDLTLSLNVDKIQQTGESYPAEAIGDQRLNDMFPDLEFWAITLSLQGKW